MESFEQVVEHEYRLDREAIARLKRRYPEWDFVRLEKEREEPAETKFVRRPLTLEDPIIKVMTSGPHDKEWHSRGVLEAIKKRGAVVPVSDYAAMNAVSLALQSLCETGTISKIHEGRGRDPHRYRWGKVHMDNKAAEAAPQSSDLQMQ